MEVLRKASDLRQGNQIKLGDDDYCRIDRVLIFLNEVVVKYINVEGFNYSLTLCRDDLVIVKVVKDFRNSCHETS